MARQRRREVIDANATRTATAAAGRVAAGVRGARSIGGRRAARCPDSALSAGCARADRARFGGCQHRAVLPRRWKGRSARQSATAAATAVDEQPSGQVQCRRLEQDRAPAATSGAAEIVRRTAEQARRFDEFFVASAPARSGRWSASVWALGSDRASAAIFAQGPLVDPEQRVATEEAERSCENQGASLRGLRSFHRG